MTKQRTQTRDAYPLAWPDHWPRTTRPGPSSFKTSLAGAVDNVRSELARFAKDSGQPISELLISSNVTLMDPRPKDAGVALYFTWDGIPTCLAVDRYARVEDNLQAIYHVIEAERTKLRHGGLNLVRAAFQGYAKLPPPESARGSPRRPWREVLECTSGDGVDTVRACYQRARSKAHPDKGGTVEAFEEVTRAWSEAQAELLGANARPGN